MNLNLKSLCVCVCVYSVNLNDVLLMIGKLIKTGTVSEQCLIFSPPDGVTDTDLEGFEEQRKVFDSYCVLLTFKWTLKHRESLNEFN